MKTFATLFAAAAALASTTSGAFAQDVAAARAYFGL